MLTNIGSKLDRGTSGCTSAIRAICASVNEGAGMAWVQQQRQPSLHPQSSSDVPSLVPAVAVGWGWSSRRMPHVTASTPLNIRISKARVRTVARENTKLFP